MEQKSASVSWSARLSRDPLPALISWGDPALTYFVRRDLTDENPGTVEALWDMAGARQLLKKQQVDGAWRYPGKSYDPRTGTRYDLLETYRNLRLLVEMYGFDCPDPALKRAAEYVFTYQSEEGDLRGILGNQYMPYYHGAMLELLVKARLADDKRVVKGLEWLLSVQQEDGGWVVPAQSVQSKKRTSEFWLGDPYRAEASKPSSHLATGKRGAAT